MTKITEVCVSRKGKEHEEVLEGKDETGGSGDFGWSRCIYGDCLWK